MPNLSEIFVEIQKRQNECQGRVVQATADGQNIQTKIRLEYLKKLNQVTGRNVIAYYSGWLSKPPMRGTDINDEDKNGLMSTIHKLDRKTGLDIILHTPGGTIAALQSIVDYLHKMFDGDIRAIVPQIAMSAGTMLACCCKEIWMGKQSNLGPIDPQFGGVPAHGVLREFKQACKQVKGDPSTAAIWKNIIGQYTPAYLLKCQNAIDWSDAFVKTQLEKVMFQNEKDAKKKAASIVKKLTDFSGNKTHERHIHYEECKQMGLKVMPIETYPNDPNNEFQDTVLSIHHCYMILFMNGPFYKAIENQNGVGLFKQQAMPTPVK